MNASTLHPHLVAADLAIQIADAACVTLIESYARRAPSNFPLGVWDVSVIDDNELTGALSIAEVRADLARAVQYLELRGILRRPFKTSRHFVTLTTTVKEN